MTGRRVPTFWVDAFVGPGLRGNPAVVCLPAEPLTEPTMQAIAAEMNAPETAFVRAGGPRSAHGLRWFSPTEEVPLCGHATLAAAHVLFQERGLPATDLEFTTKSGPLFARRSSDGLSIELPREDPVPATLSPATLRALGAASPVRIQRGPVSRKHLVELASPEAVARLRPDAGALREAVPDRSVEGVIVTAAGAPPIDLVSRFFHPWAGIDEDPVTGSAHTLLAPFWSARIGRPHLRARQLSARGGELELDLLPDRVRLTGRALVVGRGELDLSSFSSD